MKLYFYKCSGEEYSTGHVYFDYANGVAGYKKVQQRARYIGHMTVEELDKKLLESAGRSPKKSVTGKRAGYINTSRSYNYRY